MAKKKKKQKFLDMKLSNHSIDEAEQKVNSLFQAVRVLGKQKVDVKIEFYEEKEER